MSSILTDNPILRREALPRLLRRGGSVRRVLILTVLCSAGVVAASFLLYAEDASWPTPWAEIGLFLVCQWFVFFAPALAPLFAAGAIAGERERRSWDMIVVSRLGIKEIIWGKLLAALTPIFLGYLIFLPLGMAALTLEEYRDYVMPMSGLFLSAVYGNDSAAIAYEIVRWTVGLGVVFANAVLALYISLRSANSRSAFLMSYAICGGAYLLTVVGFRILMPLLMSIGASYGPGYGPSMDWLEASFIFSSLVLPSIWAVVVPALFLNRMTREFDSLDARARGIIQSKKAAAKAAA